MLARTLQIATLSLCAASALPSPARAAESFELLICQPGGPDLGTEELKVLDKLFRYLESRLGLSSGQLEGSYQSDAKKCKQSLDKTKPALVMTSLPMFLERRRELGLEPVAQPKIDGGNGSDRYYLVRKSGSSQDIATLKGKKITGTAIEHAGFIANVILEKKLGPPKALVLEPAKMGLRAIRAVIKGKAEAALLDGFQYRALRGTEFEKQLDVVYVSEPIPNAPFAIVPARLPKGFGTKLGEVLAKIHLDPDGSSLMKSFRIAGFVSPPEGDWDAIEARMKEAQ